MPPAVLIFILRKYTNAGTLKTPRAKPTVPPKYDIKILIQEANLFCDWYVPSKLLKKIHISFNYKFKKEIKFLLSKLNYGNDTFVHRDFHVSNLMLNLENKIGVIDSQDALIGNKAYDLASLIDDVRFKTTSSLKNKVYNSKLQTFINIFKIFERSQFFIFFGNYRFFGRPRFLTLLSFQIIPLSYFG